MKRTTMLCVLSGLLLFGAPGFTQEETPEPKQSIRLFVQSGSQREYLMGYHWVGLSADQKISMVERAREGALSLGAVITKPAEIYVRELDRLFVQNPALRKIEVGQAVEGIAISMKDWHDGTASEQDDAAAETAVPDTADQSKEDVSPEENVT